MFTKLINWIHNSAYIRYPRLFLVGYLVALLSDSIIVY